MTMTATTAMTAIRRIPMFVEEVPFMPGVVGVVVPEVVGFTTQSPTTRVLTVYTW